MFFIGLFMLIAVTFSAMLLSGDISVFIDAPSAIWVLLLTISFMFAATSVQQVKQAFIILINNDKTREESQYQQAKRVFTIMGTTAVFGGLFLSVLGWVALANHLDALEVFGTGFSIAALPLCYGIFLKLVAYLAAEKIQSLASA